MRDAFTLKRSDLTITDRLYSRPAKNPDFEREKDMYREAARRLATSPETVLKFLVDTVRELTHAGSMGVSGYDDALEDKPKRIRQVYVTGRYQVMMQRTGSEMPGFDREFLADTEPVLVVEPRRLYPELAQFDVPAAEMLIVPLVGEAGRLLGSIWAVHHIAANGFDVNDLRIVSEAASFMQSTVKLLTADETKRTIDEGLRSSLLHQQVLTNEASHRVKNSLQLVSSLLTMQMVSSENEALKRGLADAQRRIMAIAQVHDRLWRTGDVGKVDLSQLVKELGSELQRSSAMCKVEIVTEPVFGTPDLGNSLALMINELVTNAFKYAYPADVKGTVCVQLLENDKIINLVVEDKGIGFPKDIDPSKMKSLGMRLVYSLVRQLKGDISITNENGTRFEINIPRNIPREI